jgi:C1A family cysteine protease
MKAVVLSVAAALVECKDIDSDPAFSKFKAFIEEFRGGVGYSSEIETVGRFNVFKSNLLLAEERNTRAALTARPGVKRETHGVTQFSDLTPEEFTAKHKGYRPVKGKTPLPPVKLLHNINATAKSIDWNAKGALTPIKNQGQCGSCWAFSATEQLESQFYQKFGTLKELAPQQIVACDTADAGCNGGNPINAWGYVSGFGGQELSSDYPYTSGVTGQSGTCKVVKSDIAEDVGSSYSMIADTPSEEPNMLAQIQASPMSVCVDATLWQTYTGGVITASSGCGTSIDHAVQATGYNAEGNYWIVRNSWGPTWGENGFVWVEYGANVCGITDQATIVSVEKIAELGRSQGLGDKTADYVEGGVITLDWTDCGDSSTHGKITSLEPATLTIGTKTSIAGKGSLDEALQGATYEVTAKALGVTVFSHKGDACKAETIKLPAGAGEIDMKGFACPLSAGNVELDLDITLASTIPAKLARTTIDLKATTSTGDKALCVQIKTAPAAEAVVV